MFALRLLVALAPFRAFLLDFIDQVLQAGPPGLLPLTMTIPICARCSAQFASMAAFRVWPAFSCGESGWIYAPRACKSGAGRKWNHLGRWISTRLIHMGSTDIPVPLRALFARFQLSRGITGKENDYGGSYCHHAPID